MFENLSIGLDIATALSVIAAATAFIWNSIVSKKKELNERKNAVIKEQVFKVADRTINESYELLKATALIENKLREGSIQQDLSYWIDKILVLPNSFKQLSPIDDVYCKDGKLKGIELAFRNELNDFVDYFWSLVDPDRDENERWDFKVVMNMPYEITMKYIKELHQVSEDYFNKK